MGTTSFKIGDNVLTIDDDEETPNVSQERRVVIPLSRPTDSAVKGRARFAGGVCPLHGLAFDGAPCAKFSHLPGKGKGVSQPNPFKYLIVIGRALVKPAAILGLLFGAGYIAIHALGGITSSLVPKGLGRNIAPIATHPVSDGHGHTVYIPNVPGSDNGTVRPKIEQQSTIVGQNRNGSSGSIRANCFQLGNPCGLVIPRTTVTK